MSEVLRLFFALPVPAPLAARIEHWRHQHACNGKWVQERDLHVTLVFLGSQPSSRLAELQVLAAELRHAQCFELQLDQLACWPEGLLHLAPSQPPAGLLELQMALRERLAQTGFADEQRLYRPHLSLARHAQRPSQATPLHFAWRVESFALFSSQSVEIGPCYRLIDTWPLR